MSACCQAELGEAWVVEQLEAAGRTLLALRDGGYDTRLAQRHLDVLPERFPGYVPDMPALRVTAPTREQIAEMDRVLGWVLLIPARETLLRRVVNARCLRHPATDQYIYGWRKLAALLGKDHKFVQRRHGQGIRLIRQGLEKIF